MPLLHLDSCDHYDGATSIVKWLSAVTIITGRTNNGVYGGTKVFDKIVPVTVGAAFKLAAAVTNVELLRFNNSDTGEQVLLYLLPDSTLKVVFNPRGLSTIAQGSAVSDPTILRADWWAYVELYINVVSELISASPKIVHDTLTYEVRINEENVLSGEIELNIPYPWNNVIVPGVTTCKFGSGINWDDIYITDGEFLGDIKIGVIRPNGEGDTIEWTPLAGGTHWTETDDINPDYDTSYISTTEIDKIDMVQLEDIGAIGDIMGIQINAVAEKDDAGTCSFEQYNKINGTLFQSPDAVFPSYLNWLDFRYPLRYNPITGVAFTVGEINAMQQGVKRLS